MSDDTEKFYQFHDEVMRDAQAYAEAAARPVPVSASDESGAIVVAVDGEGAMSVTVTDAWRSTYEPGTLAAGVMQTFQDLASARLTGWAENLDGALDEEYPNKPTPAPSETTAGKFKAAFDADPEGMAEMATVLENLLGFLEDVSANFDTSYDAAVRNASATHRAEPESKHLSVEVRAGGDLQSVSFSENWLARATGAEISRELTAAIAQARAEGETSTAGPLDGTPLGKYEKYIGDPDGFIQFMRGKE